MTEELTVLTERVDDLPVLIASLEKLGLAALADQHIGGTWQLARAESGSGTHGLAGTYSVGSGSQRWVRAYGSRPAEMRRICHVHVQVEEEEAAIQQAMRRLGWLCNRRSSTWWNYHWKSTHGWHPILSNHRENARTDSYEHPATPLSSYLYLRLSRQTTVRTGVDGGGLTGG